MRGPVARIGWGMAVFLIVSMMMMSSLAMLAANGSAVEIPEEMPSVPTEQVTYVCPYSTFTANTLQFNNYSGEIGALVDWYTALPAAGTSDFVGMNFTTPWPNASGISVLEDKLWVNEITPIDMALVNAVMGTGYLEGIPLTPILVCDTDLMTWNDSEMFDALMDGLDEWDTNMTIVDRSWFPSYVLDFRIYSSAYIDLELLGSPRNITVFGLWVTNCSRETYWQETDSFLYSYYTTQKKYEVTLQIENNISTSHYYDVNWYVGFPANKIVDPQTLSVYDLDNDMYLTLGEHYDASNAGVWMSFTRINMSQTRSFTFTIYSWNATIGLGTAIAYANSYVSSSIGAVDYLKAVPTWTNNYGRIYHGAVFVQLSFDDGEQRFLDPSDVQIYDNVNGAFLEPWEFAVNGGLIIIEYAVVNVGSVQSYDVYFHLDLSGQQGFDIYGQSFIAGMSWLMLGIIAVLGLGLSAYLKKSRVLGYAAVIVGCLVAIIWIFSSAGVI